MWIQSTCRSMLGAGVDEIDRAREIVGRERRPAAEGAEAEMEAERDVRGDHLRKPRNLRDVGLNLKLRRHAPAGAAHRLQFPGAIPLDRQVFMRNLGGDGFDLRRQRRLEAGTDAL